MTAKARNATRNPALPRPARWRARTAREAAVVPALSDFGTDPGGDPPRDSVLQRPGGGRAARSATAPRGNRGPAKDAGRPAAPAPAASHATPEPTGRPGVLRGVRRLPSQLARPITGRVSAARREREAGAEGAGWIRRFPSPVPRTAKRPESAEREGGPGPADADRPRERVERDAGDRSRGRMRLGRKPRAARPADWIPVRYRVARAVGAAASALPESRAVRVGTAVAELVAANQGAIKAGLTAASVVPVLRPYVKVAATAMGAIAVARRVARAKNAAADVAAAFRGPAAPGMAHAGNGFGLDAKAVPPARAGDAAGASAVPPHAGGRASDATGDRAPATEGRDPEEPDPSAALQPLRRSDAQASTEQGREP
ncbi:MULTISPECIES: hypothetical protein [Glycomyces]|uniref:Uncharacterized protein n=2 Tax=Glycomyces TaxID=58113 RepID=A0A9X3SW84_9ACTN|nr:hypothetical protein [Glycomyces lechevalierae]MDA1387525.1 hypothetical protein [Glycomyces lechevalierae]MDR7338701.1 hypothetical protein [Glycomyces lechevalierae]